MQVLFRPAFMKDFYALEPEMRLQVEKLCGEVIPTTKDIREIVGYDIKPLRGFKDCYRVKLGKYRVGFKREGEVIIFARVLHRKDIYRYFP